MMLNLHLIYQFYIVVFTRGSMGKCFGNNCNSLSALRFDIKVSCEEANNMLEILKVGVISRRSNQEF